MHPVRRPGARRARPAVRACSRPLSPGATAADLADRRPVHGRHHPGHAAPARFRHAQLLAAAGLSERRCPDHADESRHPRGTAGVMRRRQHGAQRLRRRCSLLSPPRRATTASSRTTRRTTSWAAARSSAASSSGPTGPLFPEASPWDLDGSYGDAYGGHEIAHMYGRKHPGFCADQDTGDPNYPFPEGSSATRSSTSRALTPGTAA